MNISLDCSDDKSPLSLTLLRLGLFHKGLKIGHGLFHNSSTLNNLGKKHLSFSKEFTNNLHPLHKRTFYNFKRNFKIGSSLFGILFNKLINSLHKGVNNSILITFLSPRKIFLKTLSFLTFKLISKGNKVFCGFRISIEENVFNFF